MRLGQNPFDFRMVPLARPRLADSLVDIKPEIKIDKPSITTPINIELGALPVSIGLFAASGLTFLLRTALKEGWPRTVALVAGGGLAAAGVVNLILPKTKAAPAPATPAGLPAPASGSAPVESRPSGFTPPSASAFSKVQVEMISPQTDQEIEHLGWLFSTDRIPVNMRFYNPSGESVTLNVEFEWDEFPSLVGYSREPVHGSQAFQVTLAPNEERNQPFELTIQTSGFSTAITVGLTLYKKRTPAENRQLVLQRTFVVT